jgi:preprotein translocase subunit SecG
MQKLLIAVHLIVTVLLIGVVLMQRSEGGALGIGGGNSSGNIFSARGAGNALTRATAILAAAFFLTSISLAVLVTRGGTGNSILDRIVPSQSAPAQPGTAPKAPQENLLPNLGGESQPAKPVTPPAN